MKEQQQHREKGIGWACLSDGKRHHSGSSVCLLYTTEQGEGAEHRSEHYRQMNREVAPDGIQRNEEPASDILGMNYVCRGAVFMLQTS